MTFADWIKTYPGDYQSIRAAMLDAWNAGQQAQANKPLQEQLSPRWQEDLERARLMDSVVYAYLRSSNVESVHVPPYTAADLLASIVVRLVAERAALKKELFETVARTPVLKPQPVYIVPAPT